MNASDYKIEFELFGLPKMTNSNSRTHWRAQSSEAMKWKSLVITTVSITGACEFGETKALKKQYAYWEGSGGYYMHFDSLEDAATYADGKPIYEATYKELGVYVLKVARKVVRKKASKAKAAK